MRINKYIFIRNLALLLIVCNMLGWLFPFPNLIWRVAFVLLSLYVIAFEETKRLPCEKAVLLFTLLNLVHFFISLLATSLAASALASASVVKMWYRLQRIKEMMILTRLI